MASLFCSFASVNKRHGAGWIGSVPNGMGGRGRGGDGSEAFESGKRLIAGTSYYENDSSKQAVYILTRLCHRSRELFASHETADLNLFSAR